MVTVAPGTTAPVLSVTTPLMEPFSVCASTTKGNKRRKELRNIRAKLLLMAILLNSLLGVLLITFGELALTLSIIKSGDKVDETSLETALPDISCHAVCRFKNLAGAADA